MQQLDLLEWAASRPSNVIDLMPSLIKRATIEVIYKSPPPRGDAKVISLPPKGRAA